MRERVCQVQASHPAGLIRGLGGPAVGVLAEALQHSTAAAVVGGLSTERENSAISVGVHDTRCYRSGFQSLSSERQRERNSRSPFAAPLYFSPRQVVPVK
ncbi:Hypothetical protein SMAX5B_013651 [Scophthalmus maximus]|uniref:Uncharacterized protein n=1 Tax=Scophthalmus maximus TaxID=52904 RepID=A0A2U9BA00_SCOMX|nr:Hypothetical protein SMAX5B_013651 [Scophthalmus maximus]